jgi:choline dehydrogenase
VTTEKCSKDCKALYKATGVMFVKDNLSYEVSARREVIVSGGAINSPRLLMLSGIGPKNHLKEVGV